MSLRNTRILLSMELKKLWNDKLEFIILVLGAILLCLVYGYVAYNEPQNIDIAVFSDKFSSQVLYPHDKTKRLVNNLDDSSSLIVTEVNSRKDAIRRIKSQNSRAAVIINESADGVARIEVFLDPTDLTIQNVINKELVQTVGSQNREMVMESLKSTGLSIEQAEMIINPVHYSINTNAWQDTIQFDTAASPFIVLIVLGVCLLTSVTAITSERSTGTFERVFATPFKCSEIIISKTLARSILAVIVSAVILITLKYVFHITMASPGQALLIATLVGINGVAFGLLISSVTRIELESVSLGITTWFIFITLMGFMWPLETMHPLLQNIAPLTPYFHGVFAMRHVNLLGWQFSQIQQSLAIMGCFIVLQLLCATLLLRRELK
jgi:ABC-2 type transport system permease protein